MKDKYTYQFIKIDGLENDFSIISKWLNNQESGQYTMTVEKFTVEKKDGRIGLITNDDE